MKKIIITLVLSLLTAISSHAGTIGMSGQWSFIGQAITYDATGDITDDISLNGDFDFDAGTVYIKDDSPFLVWSGKATAHSVTN